MSGNLLELNSGGTQEVTTVDMSSYQSICLELQEQFENELFCQKPIPCANHGCFLPKANVFVEEAEE
jgi:hypothetical protein